MRSRIAASSGICFSFSAPSWSTIRKILRESAARSGTLSACRQSGPSGRPSEDRPLQLEPGQDPAAERRQLLAFQLQALLPEARNDLVDLGEVERREARSRIRGWRGTPAPGPAARPVASRSARNSCSRRSAAPAGLAHSSASSSRTRENSSSRSACSSMLGASSSRAARTGSAGSSRSGRGGSRRAPRLPSPRNRARRRGGRAGSCRTACTG